MTPPDARRAPEASGAAMGEHVDASRAAWPRRPEDGADPAVPVAGTVVLARDGAAGPEVLLIERPDRGSFAGAWVFPGGKLEAADGAAGAGEEDAARRAAVREAAEETGLLLDPGTLTTLSCWVPPPGLPLRIRTWFFVGRAPVADLVLAPGEAVAAQWSRPADVLAAHGRGELTLYPPTWVTLHGLADREDADDVIDAARLGGVRRFETVARPGAAGTVLLWQDDAEYDLDAAPPAPTGRRRNRSSESRHRLEVGTLPWRYQRTG